MLSKEAMEKLTALAAQVAEREGCILYDLEFTGASQGRVLRVFIEKPAVGIAVDDCANVSRGLNVLLDGDDLIPGGQYNLEVSSPGLERSLRLPWHFTQAVGKKARLRLKKPLGELGADPNNMTKHFNAQILEVIEDRDLRLETADQNQVTIPMETVEKAHVIFEPEPGGKKKGKGNGR